MLDPKLDRGELCKAIADSLEMQRFWVCNVSVTCIRLSKQPPFSFTSSSSRGSRVTQILRSSTGGNSAPDSAVEVVCRRLEFSRTSQLLREFEKEWRRDRAPWEERGLQYKRNQVSLHSIFC